MNRKLFGVILFLIGVHVSVYGMHPREESMASICTHIRDLSTRASEVLTNLSLNSSEEDMQAAAYSLESILHDVGHSKYVSDGSMPDCSHYREMRPGREKDLFAAQIVEESFCVAIGASARLLKRTEEGPLADIRKLFSKFLAMEYLGYVPLRLYAAGGICSIAADDFFIAHPELCCHTPKGMTMLSSSLDEAPVIIQYYETPEVVREHITELTDKAKDAVACIVYRKDEDSLNLTTNVITILGEALQNVGHPEYIPQPDEEWRLPALLGPRGYRDMPEGEEKVRFSANLTQFLIMFNMSINMILLRETPTDDPRREELLTEIIQNLRSMIRRHVQAGSALTAPINDFFQAYPDEEEPVAQSEEQRKI